MCIIEATTQHNLNTSTMAARKAVLVTGGNNGIGYEAVKSLLQSKKPYRVFLGSRSLDKAKTAIEKLNEECPDTINTVEAIQLDLNSDESIEKAYEKVSADPGYLDTLMNNAGESYSFFTQRSN